MSVEADRAFNPLPTPLPALVLFCLLASLTFLLLECAAITHAGSGSPVSVRKTTAW